MAMICTSMGMNYWWLLIAAGIGLQTYIDAPGSGVSFSFSPNPKKDILMSLGED